MINLKKKNLEKLLSVLCVVYSNLSLGDQNYGIFDGFSSLDVLFLDRENLKMKIINIQHLQIKITFFPAKSNTETESGPLTPIRSFSRAKRSLKDLTPFS